MPEIPGAIPVQCGECSAHFQLDPSGDVAGAACSECGGTRFFRDQPSPTQSDGTLRDMVDSDSQKDEGGNPLGEGTIMGDDGEKPRGFRDNYMHSKVANPALYEVSQLRQGLPQDIQHQIDDMLMHQGTGATLTYLHQVNPPQPVKPTMEGSPFWDTWEKASEWTQTVSKRVEPMRTSNMEPYPPLWDESYLPSKTAGALAELAGPVLKTIGISSLMKGVLGGGGSGQQAGGMSPEQPDPAPGIQQLGSADIPFVLLSDYDTPHSVKSIDEQHDDPENQDQKEFNDGDKSPKNLKNPNNQDSGIDGEDGVRDATEGFGFGENSPGLERANMILPLLLHYFQSDESGQGDPLVRGLHDALEKENPGYLEHEHPEGPAHVELILQHHKSPHQVQAGVNAMPGGLPAMPQPGAGMQAAGGGTCPNCGGTLAGDGSCPQCGAKQHPQGGMQQQLTGDGTAMTGAGGGYANSGASYPPNRLSTSGAGPQTPEQKAAVIQLLESQGRHGEVQLVELEPWRFAKELSQIQGQQNVAPLVDPSQAQPTPAPMSPMMNAPGAMPVPDPTQMGGGMGQPMQPMAHTGAYPMAPQEYFEDEQDRYHPRDSLRPIAPVVRNPQPTGPELMPDGLGWNNDGAEAPREITRNELAYHPEEVAHFDQEGVPYPYRDGQGLWGPQAVPYYQDQGQLGPPHQGTVKAADANNIVPRCPKCQTATTSILDGIDGEDERKYRCHSCHGVFPLNEKDSRVILADLMNPALEDAGQQAQPVGGEGSTLTWQDAEGRPLVEGQTYELHTSGYDIPEEVKIVSAKPDQLGLKLLGEMANVHANSHGSDFNIRPQDMQKYTFVPTAEAHSTDETQPTPLGGMPGLEQIPQQPATTDELSNTYPNQGTMAGVMTDQDLSDYDGVCHHCGCDWVTHTASSEVTTMHECARCGTAWETHDNYRGREASVDLSWLNENPNDDFFSDMERAQAMSQGHQSRNLASIASKDERLQAVRDVLSHNKGEREQRTAGRHFTPSEQRALVNERGSARNLEDLDLSNTHYEVRYDASGRANGLNVPDSHLLLGI